MDLSELAEDTPLGHFHIEEFLGAGGMGRVYRARDLRLNRSVAIKVLSEVLSKDEAYIAQFKREAQAIAALNHPNIGVIHDFTHEGGLYYLVLELVEGDTLSERIRQGAIPVSEALVLSRQITDALSAAHDKGIIHRDLKPENIKVTPEEKVKVLDFGLAKTIPPSTPQTLIDGPTETVALKSTGLVVGTAAYMSPEQARGKNCDKRTDIWAFGCVLYRMLTARPAFPGENMADILAAIVTKEPDWTLLPPDTPASIRRLLKRCLMKDSRHRLHDIADARLEIDAAIEEEEPEGASIRAKSDGFWKALAAVGIGSAVLIGALSLRREPAPPALDALRFSVSAPETWNMPAQPGSPLPLISPDGRRVVLVLSSLGANRLFVRDLDAAAARPVPGSDTTGWSSVVTWSPDSRFVLFPIAGKLKKLDVTVGGTAETICDAPSVEGGSWSADGTILFGTEAGGIFRVAAGGGAPVAVTTLDPARHETSHRHPQLLPDGRHFIYVAQTEAAEASWDVYAAELDSPDRKLLFTADSKVLYADPGRLLFVREGALISQPFDVKTNEVSGTPVALGPHVSFTKRFGRAAFSVSRNGVLAFREVDQPAAEMVWVDRKGARLSAVGRPGEYRNLTVSPDEKRVVFDRYEPETGNRDLWLIDILRNGVSRFTSNDNDESDAVWSPDGSTVAFVSNRHFPLMGLYQKLSNGEGEERLLTESRDTRWPRDWSPDSKFILYEAADAKTQFDIWISPVSGTGRPFPFAQSPFAERGGKFSPDGRWVLYESNESGSSQVLVQPFPAGGAKYQISTEGGSFGQWRRDGHEIFYLSPDKSLMSVPVQAAGANFVAGIPRKLFDTQLGSFNWSGGFEKYQVSQDGERFLINRPLIGAFPTITVIVNWTAALIK